jgi:hypothetical protein
MDQTSDSLCFSSLCFSTIASYSYVIELSGSSAGEYEILYNGEPRFDVISINETIPAPTIVKALFSYDGTYFSIYFSSPTNKGNTLNSFQCNELFKFTCSQQSLCHWIDDSVVSARLISSARKCTSPGDLIEIVARSHIKAFCTGSFCSTYSRWPSATSSCVISKTSNSISPTIVISSSVTIGSCDSFVLDMTASSGSCGRPWENVSILVKCTDNHNVSNIQTFIDNFYQIYPPTAIPYYMLSVGNKYFFSIFLCNFLKQCSYANYQVEIVEQPTPAVMIIGDKIRVIKRKNILTVSSIATISS